MWVAGHLLSCLGLMFCCCPAEDAAAKLPVLRALTRKFRLAAGVDLAAVAAAAPALARCAATSGLFRAAKRNVS